MTHPLDAISIASPCQVDWDSMQGNDQVRFCGECKLNVYHLSGMTREDAEALIRNTEGRLCVRYFQRHDGTIITQDCPVGLQALHRRKLKRLSLTGMSKVAAVLTVVTVMGSFCVSLAENSGKPSDSSAPQGNMMMGKPMAPAVMGEMAAPPQALQGAIPAPNPIPPKKATPKKNTVKPTKKSSTHQKKTVAPVSRPLMGDIALPPAKTEPKKQ